MKVYRPGKVSILLALMLLTLLALAALIQFVLALISETPNTRLIAFGQSLGLYLSQIAGFVSFGTEEVPFPFNAWPQGIRQ